MRFAMNSGGVHRAVGAAVALLLTGCMVGPNYQAPAPAALGVPAGYAPPVTAAAAMRPRERRPISQSGGGSSTTRCLPT